LNGNPAELQRIAVEASRFCREHGLDAAAEFELNLVLEELFMNSVRYGGCDGMPLAVRIRLQVENGDLNIEYADRGRPFDPTGVAAPDLGVRVENRLIGGFGIHLVRQLMTAFAYAREGDWNCLTMRRPMQGKQGKGAT
jgi:serine/threonine-protein kinase RsbW